MISDMGIQLDDQHLVLINLGPMNMALDTLSRFLSRNTRVKFLSYLINMHVLEMSNNYDSLNTSGIAPVVQRKSVERLDMAGGSTRWAESSIACLLIFA